MKKPYKRPFVVFTILAIVMFAALAALVVLYPMFVLKLDILAALTPIYFSVDMFLYVLNFKLLPESISWIAGAVVAVFFLVLLFVAIFGIKKKPGAKILGIIVAIFGIAVAYFGITAAYHNAIEVYAVSDKVPGYVGLYQHFRDSNWIGFAFLLGTEIVVLLFLVFGIAAIVNGVRYARAALVQDEEVVAEEVPEPAAEPEPLPEPETIANEELPVFIPEPEEEPIDPQGLSTTALAAIIKDVVREIVRDELERNNLVKGVKSDVPVGNDSHTDNHSIVGATFGGPLIVQYFNGGIQSATPAPAPAPVVEEKKEEPAPEQPKEEPQPEEPAEEPAPVVEEPAPVVEEPAPAPVPVVNKQPKAPIVRIPFEERLLASEKELQDVYSELKNEILSYGVKSRVSSSGDTFRLHRKTYIKLTVAGKSLKLYFALNPDDYRDSPIPVQDASEKGIYQEIPLVFKVKSPLSIRRCKQLIQDVMEKDSLEQGEIGTVNWIKELKAEMKARKSEKK